MSTLKRYLQKIILFTYLCPHETNLIANDQHAQLSIHMGVSKNKGTPKMDGL